MDDHITGAGEGLCRFHQFATRDGHGDRLVGSRRAPGQLLHREAIPVSGRKGQVPAGFDLHPDAGVGVVAIIGRGGRHGDLGHGGRE